MSSSSRFFLFRDKMLCDVVLVAEGVEINAHKLVLAASSPYFCAMFKDFEERTQDRIVIGGVDPDALRCLVDYIYTSEVQVTEENVQVSDQSGSEIIS
jgi:kelch-like protein 2/3